MKKITSNGDKMYILDNFLSPRLCKKYFKMINDIGYQENSLPWEDRILDITKDPIVQKVTKYINKRFNNKLVIEQAEIQNHHAGSSASLHIHNHSGREHIEYNSLIYLNEKFKGGEFYTKNGINLKPKKGMLTFFNGQTVHHGVKKVLDNDRKTIIFWWRKN